MSLHERNRAILRQKYELDIQVPSGGLVPFMENRRNYLIFIEAMHDELLKRATSIVTHQIYCLDIGTGYSAIYPLLSCKCRPEWKWFATEIDREAFLYAERNIRENGFQDRIELIFKDNACKIFPQLDFLKHNNTCSSYITFVVCNPPFYNDEQEYLESDKLKQPLCIRASGTPGERFTPGGELGFCKRIISESNDRDVLIYTCMLGKKSNLLALLNFLALVKMPWFVFHTLKQGKTWRWVIAWSCRNDLGLFCNLNTRSHLELFSRNDKMNKYIQWIHLMHRDTTTIDSLTQYLVSQLHCRINEQKQASFLYPACVLEVDSWSRKSRRSKVTRIDPPTLCFSIGAANSCHLYFELIDHSLMEAFISLMNHLRSRFGRDATERKMGDQL